MSNIDGNNIFKFSLYQNDILFCEKIYDADQFNPFTRYSIDIRDILPRIISRLQKTLSKRSYVTDYGVGRINFDDVNSDEYSYDLIHSEHVYYNPTPITQQIDDKIIHGVEFKFGLYINNNPIVERIFYVDSFNPISRWSVDIVETFVEITDSIVERIKKNDIKNIWDDYDLINRKGLTFLQVRELSLVDRERLLNSLKSC